MPSSIFAQIALLDTSSGGRKSSVFSGYVPHLVVGDGELLGVRMRMAEAEIAPGSSAQVSFELLYQPGVDYSALVPGASFKIVEGPNVVGTGLVLRT